MRLLEIYHGFGHDIRLRILLLLAQKPLCVQDLQRALEASQVEISRQLCYLKRRKLVESEKRRNWRIYALPKQKSYELQRHLECLRDCARASGLFLGDMERLKSAGRGSPGQRAARIRTVPVLRAADPLEQPVTLENHLL